MRSVTSTVQDLLGTGLGDQLHAQVKDETEEQRKVRVNLNQMSPAARVLFGPQAASILATGPI